MGLHSKQKVRVFLADGQWHDGEYVEPATRFHTVRVLNGGAYTGTYVNVHINQICLDEGQTAGGQPSTTKPGDTIP